MPREESWPRGDSTAPCVKDWLYWELALVFKYKHCLTKALWSAESLEMLHAVCCVYEPYAPLALCRGRAAQHHAGYQGKGGCIAQLGQ